MTQQEKQEIIEAVLEALQTNSQSISQLTPVTELVDSDLFEVAGGKRVTFANLVHNVMAKGVVNDLTTGGEGDALSAEMGKVLRKNVAIIAAKVDSIINALAGIAFVGSPVAPIGQLDWEGAAQTTYSVTANFTGCDATETLPQTVNELATLSFMLEAEQGYSLPYGIKVTVDGSPVSASYNRATGAVSIDAILGDVVIEAVAIDEGNTAFSGVMIEHVGNDGGYLHVGINETKYISHLIDLGASRQDSVLVKYAGGSLEMFDSNGDYIGYQSSAASETSVAITAATRYIRLHGAANSITDGIVRVSDVVAFDGSKVGSDIGDADDFFASSYCPQPNSDGDYVGWMFCKGSTTFSGWTNNYNSAACGTNVKKSGKALSLVTAIGSTSQIPWVVGKVISLPQFVDSTIKRPIKYSFGEFQTQNTTVPNMLLLDGNGNSINYIGGMSSDSNMDTNTRIRTYAMSEDYVKARMVCSITAYNASRSTETTPTYFTFLANSQTNQVLWGNDSPITNS